MRKKVFYFLTGLASATCVMSANAQNTVATVPEGMISFAIPQGSNTYLSLPLTNNSVYTSVVSAVASTKITVDDAPSPFTTNLHTAAAPYFVKFLSGNESGRVLLVTSNTASTLTLDTTDNVSGAAVALTTTSFNVQVGDTFEVFPGDTLASVFGAGTTQSPLLLTGGANATTSDDLILYTTGTAAAVTYYFNTSTGHWAEETGTVSSLGARVIASPANANNTIIYPYSAFTVVRQSNHPDTTLVLAGRVTPVAAETKVVSKGTIYTSTHYATDVKLSQLHFGSNWVTSASAAAADTLGVWNAALGQFDAYYQQPDSSWRKFPDAVTDQSNFAIAAGTVTTILKREAVTGAATFVSSSLPYSLD